MSVLAGLLPLIWFVAAVGLLILVIRLNRRLSRGSRTAGPRVTPTPDPVGLTATPWELEAIHLQLKAPPDSPARRDLVATVNRLIAASRDRAQLAPLPLSATNTEIERVMAELESKLGVQSDTAMPGRHRAELAVDRAER
jgi:hypothetical protein